MRERKKRSNSELKHGCGYVFNPFLGGGAMRLFWQLRASSTTTSYTIYISAKNHCGGAAFKTCPDFFLVVPFEVVEKLSK